MKNKFSEMFGGRSSESYNALYTALHNAADAEFDDTGKLYDYIETTPRASLVCEIVDGLEEIGYEIKKKI